MTNSTPFISSGDAGFETRLVRAGAVPDPQTGALLVPVHQNTTYLQDGVGNDRGYTYTRSGNPTVAAWKPVSAPWRTPRRRWPSPPAWPRPRPCCSPC